MTNVHLEREETDIELVPQRIEFDLGEIIEYGARFPDRLISEACVVTLRGRHGTHGMEVEAPLSLDEQTALFEALAPIVQRIVRDTANAITEGKANPFGHPVRVTMERYFPPGR